MMDADLIRYRLERSTEMLNDAEMLFSSGSLISAVNRLYYSMFYAVVALLLTKGHVSSKHSGVRALFNQHFVKGGIVPKEMGRFFGELFESRSRGDYVDYTEFTTEQVENCLNACRLHTSELWKIVTAALDAAEKN